MEEVPKYLYDGEDDQMEKTEYICTQSVACLLMFFLAITFFCLDQKDRVSSRLNK